MQEPTPPPEQLSVHEVAEYRDLRPYLRYIRRVARAFALLGRVAGAARDALRWLGNELKWIGPLIAAVVWAAREGWLEGLMKAFG